MINSPNPDSGDEPVNPGRFFYSDEGEGSVVFGHACKSSERVFEVFSFSVGGKDGDRLVKSLNAILETLEVENLSRVAAEHRADRANGREAQLQVVARLLLATLADIISFHRKTGFALKSSEAAELLDEMEKALGKLADKLNEASRI